MEFEWDERKRRKNLADHGIDFARAAKIFDWPTLEFPDDRHDYGEERTIAIGRIDADVVVVVYTWREERCRLISARRASEYERQAYYARVGRTGGTDEG